MFHKQYRKSVLSIIEHSDLVILRDNKSKENLREIYREFEVSFPEVILTSFDPAVECAVIANELHGKRDQNYVAVNLREFPLGYARNFDAQNINNQLCGFIAGLSDMFRDRTIRLIPMHYFHVGGDDRLFLNRIALELNRKNLVVQNSNLTLEDTIRVYRNAYFNIGMRFHSIVLQTIVSGRNFVLDYTEPGRGKICGFLSDIDKQGFYASRYISLQNDKLSTDAIHNVSSEFVYDERQICASLDIYVQKLRGLQSNESSNC